MLGPEKHSSLKTRGRKSERQIGQDGMKAEEKREVCSHTRGPGLYLRE